MCRRRLAQGTCGPARDIPRLGLSARGDQCFHEWLDDVVEEMPSAGLANGFELPSVFRQGLIELPGVDQGDDFLCGHVYAEIGALALVLRDDLSFEALGG